MKVPRNESYRERNFQSAKVLHMEYSLLVTKSLVSKKCRYLIKSTYMSLDVQMFKPVKC